MEESERTTEITHLVHIQSALRKCPPWSEPTLQKPNSDKKKLYDAKVKEQLLEVGDEVLVLLPMKQNKLKLQWSVHTRSLGK